MTRPLAPPPDPESSAAVDDDQGEDIEKVIEAEFVDEVIEVVVMPPAQRLVAAEAYVDHNGVPYGRRVYDPLRGSRLGGYGRLPRRTEPWI